jgi:hypothetical protein
LLILWRSIRTRNFMVPRWLVQVLHPPQKFERPPFWNGWRYGNKKYGVKVTFNGMISLLNLIKIYQLVQKLLGGTDIQTDRQTGYLTSLTFLFQESGLKRNYRSLDTRSLNEEHCVWTPAASNYVFQLLTTSWITTRGLRVTRGLELVRLHALKVYMKIGGKTPCILNLGSRTIISFMLLLLLSWELRKQIKIKFTRKLRTA